MSRLYGPAHRSLQERFDTRRLADNVEERLVRSEIPPEHKAFIESRDMFFLSTIDHEGRPTVSYKGGDPGFVRVLDSKTVAFPCYDGNGMFYSMGNLAGNAKVGMLFINFEKPHRLRLQGLASVDEHDPLLADYAEAQLVVRVTVTEIFRNCPRYIHRHRKLEPSEFVPRPTGETPLAPWKRVDDVQAMLPAQDRERVQREGRVMSRAEYESYMNGRGGARVRRAPCLRSRKRGGLPMRRLLIALGVIFAGSVVVYGARAASSATGSCGRTPIRFS